jgi:hypothetical protein
MCVLSKLNRLVRTEEETAMFMDEIVSGGVKLLKFDGRAGNYVVRDSEETFIDQEFVANIYAARGGYIKFGIKGQPPERHLGSVFPKDTAPQRASLGNTDKSQWPKAKFGGDDEREDPWVSIIEIPLRHRESGEEYVFTAQSKTSLAAAKDFLTQCHRLPEGYEPAIRLRVSSYTGKYGAVKKPLLSIVGKVPIETETDGNPFDDEVPFK